MTKEIWLNLPASDTDASLAFFTLTVVGDL